MMCKKQRNKKTFNNLQQKKTLREKDGQPQKQGLFHSLLKIPSKKDEPLLLTFFFKVNNNLNYDLL